MPEKKKIAVRSGAFLVYVTPRKGMRRLILRYQPQTNELHLSVPSGTRMTTIRTFLDSQQTWMAEQVQKQVSAPAFAAGEVHRLLGQWVTLGENAPTGEAFVRMRNAQLQTLLLRQVNQWQQVLHVRATHITLREMTSRWGSCRKSTGRLTFNTRLGCMPEELVEYVVVHELCHLVHANHSALFWQLVESCLPDYQQRRVALNHYDTCPRMNP